MTLTIQPVTSRRDLKRFVTFPWRIYRGDPNWVPPLIGSQLDKLDPARNPFWRNAERTLWLALRDGEPVGTIAAIVDHGHNRALGQQIGTFGFFECVDDQAVANALLNTAADWLRSRGMALMRGPYNPSPSDELGFLIEGFDTRPSLLEAHTPPYYVKLAEGAGFEKYSDTMAWLVQVGSQPADVTDVLPARLLRIAERARERAGARVRRVNLTDWDAEIALAGRLYNAALSHLPDFAPIPEAEFAALAAAFRPILDPDVALIVEVGGRPAGFALALPDFNEALQHANGRLFPFGALKLWWYGRRLHRISFKILVIVPEFWGRGLESVLITEIARAAWAKGYREADLSLTGEENENVQRLLAGLGMRVYRRYRIYQKDLGDGYWVFGKGPDSDKSA
jgi:GNAT superfamily N-acetyltransferase